MIRNILVHWLLKPIVQQILRQLNELIDRFQKGIVDKISTTRPEAVANVVSKAIDDFQKELHRIVDNMLQ